METFKKHFYSFQQDSVRTMLEVASKMNNMDRKLREGRNFWEESSAGKLMERMNEIFGLNIYKLEILSSTEENNEDIKNEQMKCLKEEKCEELKELVMDQGNGFY